MAAITFIIASLVPWKVGLIIKESAISSPAMSATAGRGGSFLVLLREATNPNNSIIPVPVKPRTVTTPVAPLPTTTVSASPSPGKVLPVAAPVLPPV